LIEGELDFTDAEGNHEGTRLSAIWVKPKDRWLITCAREEVREAPDSGSEAYSHLKPLEWLFRHWQSEGSKGAVPATCSWGANKNFLVVHYTVDRDGGEPKLVTVRIGWDPANEVIRSWMFDSLGGFGEGVWEREGNRWLVESTGTLPDGSSG